MIVDIAEIERYLQFFRVINAADIEQIVWVRGDEVLTPDPVAIEDHKFSGLSNRDFPRAVGGIPDDL